MNTDEHVLSYKEAHMSDTGNKTREKIISDTSIKTQTSARSHIFLLVSFGIRFVKSQIRNDDQ